MSQFRSRVIAVMPPIPEGGAMPKRKKPVPLRAALAVAADIRGTAAKLVMRAGIVEDRETRDFLIRMAQACDMHASDLGYYAEPGAAPAGPPSESAPSPPKASFTLPRAPSPHRRSPMLRLDEFTRTERGQALLDLVQEHRAEKRAIDPVAPVLEVVEAIDAAATALETGNPDPPMQALATRLRRCVDYVLDMEAEYRQLSHDAMVRRVLSHAREKLQRGARPEP